MFSRISRAVRQQVLDYAINNHYIQFRDEELQSDQVIANKLITTMLYESKRHGWDAEHCIALRNHIKTFEPLLRGSQDSLAGYTNYIESQERLNHEFYGSYLSDDSDSEAESEFQKKSPQTKARMQSQASVYQNRAQISKIVQQKKSKNAAAGELKTFQKNASSMFDLSARTQIHHGQQVDMTKVGRDIDHLNILTGRGYTLDAALAELKQKAEVRGDIFTPLFLAEYRGVTHVASKWNQSSRRAHRQDRDEIGKRQYSASVYKEAEIDLYRFYPRAKEKLKANLVEVDEKAQELQEVLLTLREPMPYSYAKYSYSNLAYLLQNIYTQDYSAFHQLIANDNLFKNILLNDVNPFVSMGDVPYHAAKYAYGLKAYSGHEQDLLLPRWKKNGRAERPYSGVLYASIHPISDFTMDGPLHLVSLNRQAEIKLESELIIVAERESCFPAYLAEGRVFDKYIAKYPSFKGEYKEIYHHKYGLTKPLFKKFQQKFKSNAPHTSEYIAAAKLLGEWLCSFAEVKLIEKARCEAEARGGVLIYRDINNRFSLTPPVDSVNRNTNKIDLEAKTSVKVKQQIRASFSTNNKKIKVVNNEDAILKILDSNYSDPDERDFSNVYIEGNEVMSTELSLMINALLNQRYKAFGRFLKTPGFHEAINQKFNSSLLLESTLLHLASSNNDIKAIEMLLASGHCVPDLLAIENTEQRPGNRLEFYENINALQLAIIHQHHDVAILLLDSGLFSSSACCDYVYNKDLLDGDMINLNLDDDSDNNADQITEDEDFLGLAWHCREAIPVNRTRGNSLLHLTVLHNNVVVLDYLLKQKIVDVNAINADGDTALDFAALSKDDLIKDKLLEAGAKSRWSLLKAC